MEYIEILFRLEAAAIDAYIEAKVKHFLELLGGPIKATKSMITFSSTKTSHTTTSGQLHEKAQKGRGEDL